MGECRLKGREGSRYRDTFGSGVGSWVSLSRVKYFRVDLFRFESDTYAGRARTYITHFTHRSWGVWGGLGVVMFSRPGAGRGGVF